MSALMNFSPSGAVRPSTVIGSPRHHLTQRQRGDTPGRGHARQRCEPFPELFVGLQDRVCVVVLPAGHGQLERQHVARIESRRDVLEMREASDQQTRADEERDREREFRNDQELAQVLPTAPDGARASRSATRVFQVGVQIEAGQSKRRRQAEDHACQGEIANVKTSTRRSMAISCEAWHAGLAERPNSFQADEDNTRPRRPPKSRKHEALGEQLADDRASGWRRARREPRLLSAARAPATAAGSRRWRTR